MTMWCRRSCAPSVTPLEKQVQVTPAISAVELPAFAVESLATECLIESIRRTRRLTKKQHRGDTLAEKLTRHVAKQELTDASSVNTSKSVDFVQLAGKAGHAAIVWRALCECHQIAFVVSDDEAKPTAIGDHERFAPLTFSQFVGRTVPVRFVERLDVQSR
jgi:hypothetical protein